MFLKTWTKLTDNINSKFWLNFMLNYNLRVRILTFEIIESEWNCYIWYILGPIIFNVLSLTSYHNLNCTYIPILINLYLKTLMFKHKIPFKSSNNSHIDDCNDCRTTLLRTVSKVNFRKNIVYAVLPFNRRFLSSAVTNASRL